MNDQDYRQLVYWVGALTVGFIALSIRFDLLKAEVRRDNVRR